MKELEKQVRKSLSKKLNKVITSAYEETLRSAPKTQFKGYRPNKAYIKKNLSKPTVLSGSIVINGDNIPMITLHERTKQVIVKPRNKTYLYIPITERAKKGWKSNLFGYLPKKDSKKGKAAMWNAPKKGETKPLDYVLKKSVRGVVSKRYVKFMYKAVKRIIGKI